MNKMILNTNQKDLTSTQQQRFILMNVIHLKCCIRSSKGERLWGKKYLLCQRSL